MRRVKWWQIAVVVVIVVAGSAGVWWQVSHQKVQATNALTAKLRAVKKAHPHKKLVKEMTAAGEVEYYFDRNDLKASASLRKTAEASLKKLKASGKKAAVVQVTTTENQHGLATLSAATTSYGLDDGKLVSAHEKAQDLATIDPKTDAVATLAELVPNDNARRAINQLARIALVQGKGLDTTQLAKVLDHAAFTSMQATNFVLTDTALQVLDQESGDISVELPMATIQPYLIGSANQPDTQKVIALTFDDGPNAQTTPGILKTLADQQIKATFFMVGTGLSAFPDTARQVQAAGHEIGDHSFNHPLLTSLPQDQINNQVNGNMAQKFYEVLGTLPTLFRPPYGAASQKVTQIVDMPVIQWSVDSQDWKSKNAAAIIARVKSTATSGGIVLMHDIQPATVQALPTVINDLKAQGYQFVTVSELLGHQLLPGMQYFGQGDARPVQ